MEQELPLLRQPRPDQALHRPEETGVEVCRVGLRMRTCVCVIVDRCFRWWCVVVSDG